MADADEIKEIIGDVQDASRSLDKASDRAKEALFVEIHREIESIWSDLDTLYRKLCTQAAARSEAAHGS